VSEKVIHEYFVSGEAVAAAAAMDTIDVTVSLSGVAMQTLLTTNNITHTHKHSLFNSTGR